MAKTKTKVKIKAWAIQPPKPQKEEGKKKLNDILQEFLPIEDYFAGKFSLIKELEDFIRTEKQKSFEQGIEYRNKELVKEWAEQASNTMKNQEKWYNGGWDDGKLAERERILKSLPEEEKEEDADYYKGYNACLAEIKKEIKK